MSNTYCVVLFFFVFLWINTTYNLKISKQAIANDLDNALKIKFLNGKSKCVLLNAMVSMFSVGICNVHDAIFIDKIYITRWLIVHNIKILGRPIVKHLNNGFTNDFSCGFFLYYILFCIYYLSEEWKIKLRHDIFTMTEFHQEIIFVIQIPFNNIF